MKIARLDGPSDYRSGSAWPSAVRSAIRSVGGTARWIGCGG
jgi:hypothetical protein